MTPRLQAIERWARERRDRTAIVQVADGRRLTYPDLWERIGRVADAVTRLAGPRVPVAIVAGPACDFEAALLGVELADAITAPLAADLPADEMTRLLRFVEPRAVVVPAALADRVRLDDLPTCAGALVIADDGGLEAQRLDRAPAPLSYEVPSPWMRFRPTSGTLSLPKFVVVSKDAERRQAEQFYERMSYTGDEVLLSGASVIFDGYRALPTLQAGATYLSGYGCSPDALARAVAAERATLALVLPWHLRRWAASPDLHPSLRSLRLGERIGPVPEADLRVLYERCGFVAFNGYGSTEAGSGFRPLRAWADGKMNSVGHVERGYRIRLVTDDGRDAEVDEPGELWVQSPIVMEGYLKDPAGTAAVLRDGWFRTGDLVRRDPDGYHWVVGRIKAMISVAGRKVHPEEVEAVLLEHPAVAQAAVSGRPDALRGERVHADVVLWPGRSATAGELQRFVRARLAAYKAPRTITFVESLRTSDSGKVVRRRGAPRGARAEV